MSIRGRRYGPEWSPVWSTSSPIRWTTSSAPLYLDVDLSGPRKAEQLRRALREAIGDGVLAPGTKLPSTRTLAEDLGIARGVVVEVYEQLAAEGWLATRQGSGTTVACAPATVPERPAPPPVRNVAPLDLRPARPDVAAFPRAAWATAARQVLTDLPHRELTYGDHRGPLRAREVVAAYLARVRGVRADPELTLLTVGFSEALSVVVTHLVARGSSRLAVEDPGGYEPRRVAEAAGAELVPIPVDGEGLRVDVLERSDAGAVLVTPAHQYPLGHVLSAERRLALAAWARRAGGWVLEDDYDAEFRYDREPVGSVQALLPDRTIHLGSVAKTLAPAVRVGWVLAPPAVFDRLVATRFDRSGQLPVLDHLVLAQLIDEGRYDRHLRALRRAYRQRRDVLLAVLTDAGLGDQVVGVAAGLHAVLLLPGQDDVAVADRLHDEGVEVVPLSRYAVASDARGLVIGYGQQRPAALRRGLTIIAARCAPAGR